jgi:hypothetical protein
MRNLSLPVVWEDADMPEEWERDASSIPKEHSKGRYVYWAWTHGSVEKQVMPFAGNTSDWPGTLDLSRLVISPSNINTTYNASITPPASMGMLFRDPGDWDMFQQGNAPFRQQMEAAGMQPTDKWPSVLYGSLPNAWGQPQADTGDVLFPELEVM